MVIMLLVEKSPMECKVKLQIVAPYFRNVTNCFSGKKEKIGHSCNLCTRCSTVPRSLQNATHPPPFFPLHNHTVGILTTVSNARPLLILVTNLSFYGIL